MLSQSHPTYLTHLRLSASKAKSGSDKAIVILSMVSMAVLVSQAVIGMFNGYMLSPFRSLVIRFLFDEHPRPAFAPQFRRLRRRHLDHRHRPLPVHPHGPLVVGPGDEEAATAVSDGQSHVRLGFAFRSRSRSTSISQDDRFVSESFSGLLLCPVLSRVRVLVLCSFGSIPSRTWILIRSTSVVRSLPLPVSPSVHMHFI